MLKPSEIVYTVFLYTGIMPDIHSSEFNKWIWAKTLPEDNIAAFVFPVVSPYAWYEIRPFSVGVYVDNPFKSTTLSKSIVLFLISSKLLLKLKINRKKMGSQNITTHLILKLKH